MALGLLQLLHGAGQPLVFLHEEGLAHVGGRHVLQHLGQSGQHPSVATSPEVFLPVGRLVLRVDVFAVAEVEARLRVEHDAVAVEDILVELAQILCISCKLVHLRHHGHYHVEGVGPPPVVVGPRVGLEAHHLAGTGHFLLVGLQVIEVDISLEADLPVAEEHVVLALAIFLVLPLALVGLRSTLPLVVLRPTDAVVEHRLVLQQIPYFDVAGVVGSIVPEGTHLSGIVRLPIGIHTTDDVLHFSSRPLLCLHGKAGKQGHSQK